MFSLVEDSVGFAMRLVNCNCISVVRMSIMVLPQMVQKRKGLIINVSSAAALLPTPLMTMYSSTKAFVHKFSQDISLEYRPYGVTIQCVLPGFVATNMSRIRRSSLSIPTPEKFVKEHLKTLGLEVWSAGYWCHNLQLTYYRTLMHFFEQWVETFCRRQLATIRQKALFKRSKINDITSSIKEHNAQDLALEYKPCGVVVQCVTPGFVATNMSRIRRHSLSIPTPQTFVKEHIHTFGLETWSGGYWYHKLQWAYYGNLMLFLESYVENLCRRSLALIREKAKKKRAAQKEKLALLEEKKVELGKEHTA
ncbi:hypothetical protein QYM36_018374 [Artemia franciscana]|uniref:Estradiol 17-beta-dehydrogenase 12 n=1 Tax=Artemia franciscana TaxID=6661 RepID=A0AA88KUT8_ARTSF|nr:hypothetical protein QYM36_018374 [Artemia franciscana]